ncbi:MAG: YfhO family protein [Bacteroidetes bacterium]|nr:YfhO family protein [Bacteroidota bacterium]
MNKIQFRNILPYGAAVLIFLVITLAYLYPLLEGKKIYQYDIINFKGVSKEISDFRDKTGQEPLWTNSMYGGMPAYQVSTRYPGNLTGYLDTMLTLGLPHPANTIFLYFIGFFILLVVMKVDPWLAIAGALAFGFSSFFFIIIDVGHNSEAHAIAWMAPLIAGMILTLRKKYWQGGILTAVFLSLEIKANHPQITYYLAIIALLLLIFKLAGAIRRKEFGSFAAACGVMSVALVFAVLTNITTLWATLEYTKYTVRGKSELATDKQNRTAGIDRDYATHWSYGIPETMTLLIPDIYGGASGARVKENSEVVKAMQENGVDPGTIRQFTSQPVSFLYYWGKQPSTSGPVYVGAIVCFLFFMGLFIVRGPLKWWLLSATLLSVILAWGHNFMAATNLFLDYFPGYNKFRAVTMILVIAEFCMPLLGILAVKEFLETPGEKKRNLRGLQAAFLLTAGVGLLFAFFPGLFFNFTGPNDAELSRQYPDWFMSAVRGDRLSLLRGDAIRSFAFITFAALLLIGVNFGKVQKKYLFPVLALLILADMFTVNKRYLNSDSFAPASTLEVPYEPTQADQQILRDTDPDYRVFNLSSQNPFIDPATSYFHKSLGGYSGVKMRRYQELWDRHISNNNMAVLNMLNTKYFIVPDKDRQPQVQLNPGALGSAWFVQNVKLAAGADEELASLTGFRPDSIAIVDRQFSDQLKGFTGGRDTSDRIRLETYAPNRLVYQYNTSNNGLAVFSEIWYPKGWNAYVDGRLTPHFRANYVLRAMVLPAGAHKLEFRFEPVVYAVGEKVSLVSSMVLLVLLIGMVLWEIRRYFGKTIR